MNRVLPKYRAVLGSQTYCTKTSYVRSLRLLLIQTTKTSCILTLKPYQKMCRAMHVGRYSAYGCHHPLPNPAPTTHSPMLPQPPPPQSRPNHPLPNATPTTPSPIPPQPPPPQCYPNHPLPNPTAPTCLHCSTRGKQQQKLIHNVLKWSKM